MPGPGRQRAWGAVTPARARPPRTAGVHRAPRNRRLRLLLLVVIAALAVGTPATVLLLSRDTDLSRGTDEDPAGGGDTASQAAEEDGTRWTALVQWARAELPSDTLVAVPADLRAELVEAGADESRLIASGASDTDARDAVQVVSGRPPAGSWVLARFGDGSETTLTLVDPTPVGPTAEEADRRARLSAAVLANPGTGATGRAAEVLQTADIDARLLGLLAALVARLDVRVADFPPDAGGPVDGPPPARRVLLDRLGDERLEPGAPATDRLSAFLAAQLTPFAPDTVEVTDDGVLVGFRYASAPDSVVTENTP